MRLLVSAQTSLERRFGADGYERVRHTLEDFANRVPNTGVAIVDDAESMAALGTAAVPLIDAAAILTGVRAVRRARSDVSSIVLVGSDAIVPHCRLANPAGHISVDPDTVVYSDNPYGSDEDTLAAYLSPVLPVGRLCEVNGDASTFAALIDATAARHESPASRVGTVSVIDAEWSDASAEVAGTLVEPLSLRRAPGYAIDGVTRRDMARGYLYFNLHGFATEAAWKAFDPIRGQFITVATPASFERQFVRDALVFAENCYGALTVGKDASSSCALRLMNEGVAGFIGATGLAFGSVLGARTLVDNADLLAVSFFGAIGRGASFGAALLGARRAVLDASRDAAHNVFHQKTLLQFILLGDPTLS